MKLNGDYRLCLEEHGEPITVHSPLGELYLAIDILRDNQVVAILLEDVEELRSKGRLIP